MNLVIFDKDNRTEMAGIGIVAVAVFAAGIVVGLGYVHLVNWFASEQRPQPAPHTISLYCSEDGIDFQKVEEQNPLCSYVRVQVDSLVSASFRPNKENQK